MIAKLTDSLARFDAMSVRERLLILVTVVVAIALPVLMYLIEPAQKEQTKLGTALAKMEAENAQTFLELATLRAQSKLDPNAALREQVETLNNRIDSLNAELKIKAAQLISPEDMLGLLEQVLSSQKRLQLISLQKGNTVSFQSEGGATGAAGVYRHDLTLTVEGRFFDVIAYLEALEQLPRTFFWDQLEYQVGTYPNASVTLKVHTLSTAEGWLGV